ncbi:MAG: hypothetical protein H2B00_08010 [Nitrosopumilaceae archaeon]|jgi:hypothetical protein|uniref:Uncharacterized protein n=2 Tax=Candidatus Nitrosomaritimum aestuariumsis TaxID=3342354 RepID=A0AC60VXS2_9ARCH|nr:hypothetical protein [Nitrosopumilaceae archaeon]MBA4460124.1 hypothetical protein [Nitrosopumilaceae archaeon]MBA4462438.1 hypothetical protein [Nitrosopumilaceae archaeon]MBA4462752.1 hypothetical protein [Nitrosopumilaceae archaeon]
MEEGEKRLRQEDCNEDSLGAGILTLTNRRVAFDKTRARMMDFSKQFGDTLIDAPLDNITKVWKEGILMKKICLIIKTKDEEKTCKFGVFNSGKWRDDIQKAIDDFKN